MRVTMQKENKRLIIVDGNAHVCRAYFAIRMLTDAFGRPCNAVFGFVKILLHILEAYTPTHIIVFFDSYSKWRKEIYPDYKSNRKKEGLEDLHTQLPIALELSQQLGFYTMRVEGYESDDLIASAVDKAKQEQIETLIFTSDKDMCQLVTDDGLVKMLRPGYKGISILDRQGVIDKYGVTPEHMRFYLALVGDTSDNIPGVKGFGEKTVVKLLNELRPGDNILNVAERILSPKMYTKLQEQQHIFRVSLALADLNATERVAMPEIDELEFTKFGPNAREYVQSLGFQSLLSRI